MEVAGLVLAVYPATILAFEQYKKGAKYFSHWIQFRRRYESFIRDMEGQQLFFEGILQDLLCGGPNPYLVGGDSKDSFLDTVSDANFTGWRDPVLKQRLVTRLDSRYDWCMYTITRIYDLMTELGKLLDIQLLDTSGYNAQWWSFQLQRITQSLFDGRYTGHEESKRLIGELKQMIELSDQQSLRGGFRSKTISSGLGPFFTRTRENANSLHGVLKSGWSCCCKASHKVLLQLERKVDQRDDNFNVLCCLPKNPEDADDEALKYLQHSLDVKITKQPSSKIVNKPTCATTEKKSIPTPSVTSTQASAELRCIDGQPKKEASLRDRVSDVRSSFKSKFSRKAKTKEDKLKVMKQFAIAEHMQVQARFDAIETETIEVTSSVVSEPPPVHIISKPLIDLCQTISSHDPGADTFLGCMPDEQKNLFDFYVQPDVTFDGGTRTLGQILEDNSVHLYLFPPERRTVVAAVLASSILQLQKTYWLSSRLDKNDIFFTTRNGKPLFDHPYLSQSFLSTTHPKSSTPTPTCSPPPTKVLLESLGIILIELCFGLPIESFSSKTQLRPLSPTHNHEYHLAIAHAWTWEEIRAQDSLFSDAVQSCLHFPRGGGMGSDEAEDIYRLIAEPLYREMVRRWPERR